MRKYVKIFSGKIYLILFSEDDIECFAKKQALVNFTILRLQDVGMIYCFGANGGCIVA